MELMKVESTYGTYDSVMDSREIADVTNKDHGHICRDIQKLLEDLGLDQSKFGSVYKAGNGEDRKCYLLPKRECLILVSGYHVRLRAAIIDRWAELEASTPFSPAFPVPRTMSEALRLAADLSDALEAAKPAVEFVARFVDNATTQPLRAVAKVLKVNERAFVAKLVDEGILYRLAGKLTPAARHMDTGRFEVKEIVAKNGHATTQMRFTTKGVEWIAGKVQEWAI